ncbi:hypothetical protein H8356DRAFT_1327012 [Neocallimastix lanati (nom. inval.)]|nr:hypothetical protein H8356DRAFT_1327012 [Neocallimastix sp. JGI-2020a]
MDRSILNSRNSLIFNRNAYFKIINFLIFNYLYYDNGLESRTICVPYIDTSRKHLKTRVFLLIIDDIVFSRMGKPKVGILQAEPHSQQ